MTQSREGRDETPFLSPISALTSLLPINIHSTLNSGDSLLCVLNFQCLTGDWASSEENFLFETSFPRWKCFERKWKVSLDFGLCECEVQSMMMSFESNGKLKAWSSLFKYSCNGTKARFHMRNKNLLGKTFDNSNR